MFEFLDGIGDGGYGAAIFWALAALVALAAILLIVRMVRGMNFGTFVAGGRNRKTRLAVMDATAVDTQRRLVLVRRDDVEHLILIGGPTDVVVERDIRLAGSRRTVSPVEAAPVPSQPRTPTPQPPRSAPPQPPVSTPARSTASPAAPPAPARPHQPEHAAAYPPPQAGIAARQPSNVRSVNEALDDSLASELAVSLDDAGPAVKPGPTPDDEMSRLLGELSSGKR